MLGVMEVIAITRVVAWLTVAVGSAWLVSRYRWRSFLLSVPVSVLAGSVILYLAYHAWPMPPGVWDEDGEDIHIIAPILLTIWCFPIWLFVGIRAERRKARGESL
jgi:hypothetical protein